MLPRTRWLQRPPRTRLVHLRGSWTFILAATGFRLSFTTSHSFGQRMLPRGSPATLERLADFALRISTGQRFARWMRDRGSSILPRGIARPRLLELLGGFQAIRF